MNLCYLRVLYAVVFYQLITICNGYVAENSCPKIFYYRFENNQWYGLMVVKNSGANDALDVMVTLSVIGKHQKTAPGQIQLLTLGQHKKDVPIWYKVNFPRINLQKYFYPPKVTQISVNRRVICVGKPDQGLFVTLFQLEHIRKNTYLPKVILSPARADSNKMTDNDVENIFQREHSISYDKLLKSRLNDQTCGKANHKINFYDHIPKRVFYEGQVQVVTSDELMNNKNRAEFLSRGSWPWLAAIYVTNDTSLTYQCAGTLISSNVVVSAAHCFHINEKLYTPNEVLIFLGRHNLRNWNEEHSFLATTDSIVIHPDFDSQLISYDGDVAVIILSNKVQFNEFIRPACLWRGSDDFQYIEGEHGVVVGWNLGSNPDVTTFTTPKAIQVPIVTDDVCFLHDDRFRSISSNRTFCAGNVEIDASTDTNRTKFNVGPCAGDSGAGLLISKNNRWNLRGIVSATIPYKTNDELKKFSCISNQYVIYTDAAKFFDWIFSFTL